MIRTHLSSKGQVVIPKAIRVSHGWRVGEEFVIEDTEQGLLLRPLPLQPFARTVLKEVAGCIAYQGPRRSLEEMENAIAKGAKEHV